jgi:hypothetical protein
MTIPSDVRKAISNFRYSPDVLVVFLVLTFLFTIPRGQSLVFDNWRAQSDSLRRAGLYAVGSSNVTFLVSPALQVNITFNGRNYTNGQGGIFPDGYYNATATLAKSLTTIPPPPSNCTPSTYYTSIWEFHNWATTNNLTIQGSPSSNPANVSVAGSGNLTANLIRGYIGCPADVFPAMITPILITAIILTTVARLRKRSDSR